MLLIEPIDDTARTMILAGLVLSLIGDVFLLADSSMSFLAGLGSFLVAHIAYIAAFIAIGILRTGVLMGLAVGLVGITTLGRRIVGGVATRQPSMKAPAIAYMAVISIMVVAAFGTGLLAAIVGAIFFYLSDAAIAWTRFVHDHGHGRLFVIVTYHLAQLLIVVSLV